MARKANRTPLAVVETVVQPHKEAEEAIVAKLPVVNTCITCRHYLTRTETYGFCRRYPPTILAGQATKNLTEDGPFGIFPITLSTSLCGEHAAP